MKKYIYLILPTIIMLNGCAGVSYNNEISFEDPKRNIEQFNFKENIRNSQIDFKKTTQIDFSEKKIEKYNFNSTDNFGSQKYRELDKTIDKKDIIDFSKTEKINFNNNTDIDFNKIETIDFNKTETINFNDTDKIAFNEINPNKMNEILANKDRYEVINVDRIMKQDKEETKEIKNTIKEIPGKIVDFILYPGKVVANALYPTTIDVVNSHNEEKTKEYLGTQYKNVLDYNLGKEVDYDSDEDY